MSLGRDKAGPHWPGGAGRASCEDIHGQGDHDEAPAHFRRRRGVARVGSHRMPASHRATHGGIGRGGAKPVVVRARGHHPDCRRGSQRQRPRHSPGPTPHRRADDDGLPGQARPGPPDGEEFLAMAAQIPLLPTTTVYPLSAADEALADLAADRVTGAAVLRVDGG